MIWNHYTVAQRAAVACQSQNYFPPPPVIRLERLPGVRVYYLCTEASQEAGAVAYYEARRDEIVALGRRFVDLGVSPGRIFLAGQSGGATSSALAYLAAPEVFGGAIMLAPAWTGMGEGLRRRAGLDRDQAAGRIAAALTGGTAPLEALVVAFERDAWNTPRDLAFLRDAHPGTVTLYTPRCGADHGGAYKGCGVEPVGGEVTAWLAARLGR